MTVTWYQWQHDGFSGFSAMKLYGCPHGRGVSMLHVLMTVLAWIVLICSTSVKGETDTVAQALEYVFQLTGNNCGAGTGEVLPLQFDVAAWNQYTDPAIRTANLLSKIISQNNGTLDSLTDEMFFLLVRNNVHGDSLIFGSAIALEMGVYSKYNIFCPYAYKKNDTVHSHDISINYNYLDPDTEWYDSVKVKAGHNVTMVVDGISYRDGNSLVPEIDETYPIAELADGHWTNPYYDCGGGDIWMVTYSSPIFSVENDTAVFQGVATIDIEMTYIDINQCDDESITTGLDVFRGTHTCQPTTMCIPVAGKGFVPGAYTCNCVDGYYFPDLAAGEKTFKGEVIEDFLRQGGDITGHMFRCSACAVGCDTCVDSSPCLFQRNEAVLIALFFFNAAFVLGIIAVAAVIYLYRRERVIKSASPIFLELMCLGGLLICCHFFTMYSEANRLVCSIRIWPKHLGFGILYGSLILKTWRISQIFSVGTQKRIRLPDQVLLQRFGMVCLFSVALLAAWTGSKPPEVVTYKFGDGLKFYACDVSLWDYSVLGLEILFLLYGVYLCFTVRKAPAHFNESKHITWAVYNAIILGSFMSLMLRLVISVIGPDLMLVLQFAQAHVYSTITLLLIFAPKFHALYKKLDPEPDRTAGGTMNSQIQTITGRIKKSQVLPRLSLPHRKHIATQTEE